MRAPKLNNEGNFTSLFLENTTKRRARCSRVEEWCVCGGGGGGGRRRIEGNSDFFYKLIEYGFSFIVKSKDSRNSLMINDNLNSRLCEGIMLKF